MHRLADIGFMAVATATILSAGGIRSLVATAAVASDTNATQVILIHLRREDATGAVRLEHVRRQAEHFGIEQVTVIPHPPLPAAQRTDSPVWPSNAPLTRPQCLLLGLAHASELNATQLTWPIQLNANHDAIARATEQVVLLEHLAQLEGIEQLSVRTPLLDLTDQQVIELGGQMNVPFELAWSCLIPSGEACEACIACRRRRAAFNAAGMVDPTEGARNEERGARTRVQAEGARSEGRGARTRVTESALRF